MEHKNKSCKSTVKKHLPPTENSGSSTQSRLEIYMNDHAKTNLTSLTKGTLITEINWRQFEKEKQIRTTGLVRSLATEQPLLNASTNGQLSKKSHV